MHVIEHSFLLHFQWVRIDGCAIVQADLGQAVIVTWGLAKLYYT